MSRTSPASASTPAAHGRSRPVQAAPRSVRFRHDPDDLNQTLSPGLEQWQYFHSSQAGVKGSKNYAGIANPVVDHLLEQLLAAKTRDEQVAAGKALDRALLWQHYIIPNWYLNYHRLAYRNRFGLRHHAALHPGPERVVAEIFGERSMKPARALLLQASGLLFAGLAFAAPQHALTLYNEPPKYPADFKHFDYVNPDAPKGGIFRQAGFGGFDSLNPFISKGVPADDIDSIYDTLAKQGLDEPFTEYGLIAGKIEKAPDNSWVRFYLRPEARFHDGHPVRADDVVFSFQTLIKDGAPMYRGYYSDVEEVIAEDPLTVLFKFKHSNNRELPLILGQLPVLPKHWWASRDFNKGNLEIPLGSGPYKVTEVKAGRSVRYERVKDYWGKDLPVNRGFYNFDVMTTDYYRDNTVALEALKAGQFDYWLEMTAKNWANAYNIPAVTEGRLIKEQIPNGNPDRHAGLRIQPAPPGVPGRARAPGPDPAAGLRMDQQATVQRRLHRTRSYFENSEMAATGLPDADQLAILEPFRSKIPDAGVQRSVPESRRPTPAA